MEDGEELETLMLMEKGGMVLSGLSVRSTVYKFGRAEKRSSGRKLRRRV